MNSILESPHSEWFHGHHPKVKLFIPLYLEIKTKTSKFYLFSPDPQIEMSCLKISGEYNMKAINFAYLNIIFIIKHSKLREVSLGYCVFSFSFP